MAYGSKSYGSSAYVGETAPLPPRTAVVDSGGPGRLFWSHNPLPRVSDLQLRKKILLDALLEDWLRLGGP